MTETSEQLQGQWKSQSGQMLVIRRLPILGVMVTCKPIQGRPRFLKVAEINSGKLSLYLSWLGPLQAMLHLRLLPDPETEEIVLVPELEAGPETSWEREDLGFPWLFPLREYHRVSP